VIIPEQLGVFFYSKSESGGVAASLPGEITSIIALYLTDKDLMRFALTCKQNSESFKVIKRIAPKDFGPEDNQELLMKYLSSIENESGSLEIGVKKDEAGMVSFVYNPEHPDDREMAGAHSDDPGKKAGVSPVEETL